MTTVTYQCPNCGAGLAFDAEKQKFACEFCLSEFSEAEAREANSDEVLRERESAEREYNEHMNEYECPSCGAHVVADENTAASFCYYCHNPVVLVGRLSGQMRPHRIIPFKYDKAQAEKKFLEFAKRKWFVPRGFFAPEQVEKITGVYYPFWITDADTDSTMTAHATRLRVWRTGRYEYTETSNFEIYRHSDSFCRVPHPSGRLALCRVSLPESPKDTAWKIPATPPTGTAIPPPASFCPPRTRLKW